ISDGRREFLASGKGKALVRMGLVEMKSDPVVFWFEKYQEGATAWPLLPKSDCNGWLTFLAAMILTI
ncbi:HNH endonuclease, partial [Shigella flexneri]